MTHPLEIPLPDAEATARLGAALSARLHPGDTMLLSGEIGAGKSHLARALIQARLGADTIVPSPSFTLVQVYEGPPLIWHVDLYRIGDASEVFELGLDEAMGTALCLVEWPERTTDWPSTSLTLTLHLSDGGRLAVLSWKDAQWGARLDGLCKDMRDG